MTPGVLGKLFLWWLGILLLAILNGALRERILIPQFGIVAGLVCSGLLLAALVVAVAFIATPAFHYKGVNLWAIGAFWLLLTLICEFTLGLAIQRKPLSEVLDAYTFRGGNLWPLVLLVILLAPRIRQAYAGCIESHSLERIREAQL
jgi:hypothetical protein